MRTLSATFVLLATLASQLALAQAPSVDSGRVSRRCAGATLNTDPAAPCADDVLVDRAAPTVVRPGEPFTSGTPSGGASLQPLPGAPTTSVGTTPGTPTTSVGTTPGTPNTSVGAAPGTGSTSVGAVPGTPSTSTGTTPGVPVTSTGAAPGISSTATTTLPVPSSPARALR